MTMDKKKKPRTTRCLNCLAGALYLFCLVSISPAQAGSLTDTSGLQRKLEAVAKGSDGRVGICAEEIKSGAIACVNGDQRFSLQSVMKLVVGAAAMDAIDRGQMRLEDVITVRKKDLSLYVQPIADLVAQRGEVRTTVADLISRAIIESDSAATDLLFAQVGGAEGIQTFLKTKKISGLRVDRDEKHLQTEIVGLIWRPEYVDADVLDKAIKAVPSSRRDASFAAYLKDERDTATPRGMVTFLSALARGKLLSAKSTAHLLKVMQRTVTFPDRLKAGVPQGWTLGHKTGTSLTWRGVTAVTNDVGILTAPDGGTISVAVFVAESRRSSKERAKVIAATAKTITSSYR